MFAISVGNLEFLNRPRNLSRPVPLLSRNSGLIR
jgi:hypothetical protein